MATSSRPSSRHGQASYRPGQASYRPGQASSRSNASLYGASTRPKNRPRWDARPRYDPPPSCRHMRPVTKEPWAEAQNEDMDWRMDFGSRNDLGYGPPIDKNGLVEEAKERRKENAAACHWVSKPIKHMPPALRGQKHFHREEPWSESQQAWYHDDSIDMLNAIEDVPVNEIFEETQKSGMPEPSVVQPEWNPGMRMVPFRQAMKKTKEILDAVEMRNRHAEYAGACRAQASSRSPTKRRGGSPPGSPFGMGDELPHPKQVNCLW